jgi:hypothetical protein
MSRHANRPFDGGVEVVELAAFDQMLGEASLRLRAISPSLPKPLMAIPGTLATPVIELRCVDNQQISPFLRARKLVEIVVRVAHVRVFRLVTDFRREFRVTAMDVRNV